MKQKLRNPMIFSEFPRQTEPRLMFERGVEGDLFFPHNENGECAAHGCVPMGDRDNWEIYTRRAEFEVYGRQGLRLSDYWAKGMRTYHGFLSHGFPNLFRMGLTQTGLAPNFTYMLEGQATHIAHVVDEVKAREGRLVEPTPEAEAEWVKIVTAPSFILDYQNTCTPGYYNGEGQNAQQGFLDSQYPAGAVRFYELLARWREQGDFEGLKVE